jgi:predicted nucleotidyltransferase
MKTLEEIKTALHSHKHDLAARYKIKKLGIFGSYVTGSAEDTSDVDILVELAEPIGLDFVELADNLETILGMSVDLVSRNAIKPNVLPYITEDLVYV